MDLSARELSPLPGPGFRSTFAGVSGLVVSICYFSCDQNEAHRIFGSPCIFYHALEEISLSRVCNI